MQIDYTHFTPLASFAGGALIGLSAGLLILLAGKIAGIAGIVGGLVNSANDRTWRVLFVIGLLAAPWAWQYFAPLPDLTMVASTPWLIIAGLLVGIGTRYANGCTSGHGICGLSRLSVRSLAAVVAFMGAGFLTVLMIKHIL
ncbi:MULTISPECIES: YeeE/YedE family protein [Deefgea]|uniref:YeeE/YedE family protein n=1 Tax=Deefgea chitinilytica TaxID=570276 RepID=A0ABS2CBY1_9NEIS|nr:MULTISPECIES: YeeE/YedE thiosulfate transporter family protein [Deefgea]MBM5570861.1 YeeE/YedE family protein [Deefgea chitinilytica]MBM9888090.1 YeeE/YedE family protein [Deefgea sp. CFH1-16]